MEKISNTASQNLLSSASHLPQLQHTAGSPSTTDFIRRLERRPQPKLPPNRPTTPMVERPSKVDLGKGNQGMSHSKPQPPSLPFFAAILARFRRADAKKGVKLVAECEEINRLRQDLDAANFQIAELQRRCADLEGSDRSSELVDLSLQRRSAEVLLDTGKPAQDSELKTMTMVQAVDDQTMSAGQEQEIKGQARPALRDQNEADRARSCTMQLDMTPRDLKDIPHSLELLDYNPSSVVLTRTVTQHLQTDEQRLPRKRQENKEVEAHPSCVYQERLPRKGVELQDDTQPADCVQERLPRKKMESDADNDNERTTGIRGEGV